MNLLVLETLSRLFDDPFPEWCLRRDVLSGFGDHLNLSADESEMVINHLCGEGYLRPVTIHFRGDDHQIRREIGYTASDKIRVRVVRQHVFQELRNLVPGS